jgi:benzoyl-CoA reductase/2-hydroxyglutaryl-CoA dehydratase subunit BcrC/BadD/HgdB
LTSTSPLEPFARLYADRTAAARAWKAAGGRVVGYLCDNVPTELIEAAGFFPLRVSGDPDVDLSVVREKVDRLYPPDVTARPAFVGALLAQLLSGAYGLADYLIVPHNRDAIQAIFRQLKDARRADPTLRTPHMHYLDKAWSPFFAAETYNRDRLFEFRAVLEAWADAPIDDERLSAEIAAANLNRRLLADVAALRAASPPRLSGVEALQVIGTSMLTTKSEHNAWLAALLQAADALPARDGPRVFVGGSPHDHARIYEAIEACGAVIVAEDHCWGDRAYELPVGEGDPMLALAARFHQKPACSIRFPVAAGAKACARRSAAASADGAIFYVMDEDWTQVWETPGQAAAVEAAGTPTLRLLRQSYAGADRAALEDAVRPFIERLAAARVGAPA